MCRIAGLTWVRALQEAENDDEPPYTKFSELSDPGFDLEKLRRRIWIKAPGGRDLDRSKAMVMEVSIPDWEGSKEIEGSVMMSVSSSGVLVPIEEEDEEEDELDDEEERL